jgi:glutathione reductase (NADPH)
LEILGAGHLTTSDQFFELNELPRRILFIGGGYIAFEFAHVAARVGSQVTVLHRGPRPLPLFDPDLVDQLVEGTRELGVDIHLGTEATGIEKGTDKLIVRASSSGEIRLFQADMVVHAAGRVPEFDDLNLEAGEIEWEDQGVRVDEFLQSVSNPAVYAAGDAAASGGPPLAPVAGYEGRIVVANLLEGNHARPNYLGIPSVIFTIPPLAAVGLSEDAAREQNLKFRVKKEVTSTWYSSRRVAEVHSGYKVLVEDATDRILSAHLLGSAADEVINLFALAIQSGMRLASSARSRTGQVAICFLGINRGFSREGNILSARSLQNFLCPLDFLSGVAMHGEENSALLQAAFVSLCSEFRDTHADQGAGDSAHCSSHAQPRQPCHDWTCGYEWAQTRDRQ